MSTGTFYSGSSSNTTTRFSSSRTRSSSSRRPNYVNPVERLTEQRRSDRVENNCTPHRHSQTGRTGPLTYEQGIRLGDLTESNSWCISSEESEFDITERNMGDRDDTPPLESRIENCESSFPDKDVISILQKQQDMLQQVFVSLEKIKDKQSNLEDRLVTMENLLHSPSTSCDGKRKRVVTRSLSKKVYSIHKEMDNQFIESQPFSSDVNKKVKAAIISDIKSLPNCEYDESNIALAVRRCYENLRRTFLEQKEESKDHTEEQAKQRKYRSRRERKFRRRSSVVKKNEMEKYWKNLSLKYMTEESDDSENPNGIVEHKLPWRSNNLNNFIEILDKRLSKNLQQPSGLVAKKVRREGAPSSAMPPDDAPSWAIIRGEQRQGHDGDVVDETF